MRSFLQALNKPIDALGARNKWVAWGLVAITIITNTVFEPFLGFFADTRNKIDIPHMLLITVLGIATYLIICAVFWLVCKCFGSKTSYMLYIQTWGITYFPTLLCSIVVAFTEVYFYIFWNSVIWGMVFNILFVGILLWKTVLYVIYLRKIAGLTKGKMIGAFVVIGLFIILLAMANGFVGLKTPIL